MQVHPCAAQEGSSEREEVDAVNVCVSPKQPIKKKKKKGEKVSGNKHNTKRKKHSVKIYKYVYNLQRSNLLIVRGGKS